MAIWDFLQNLISNEASKSLGQKPASPVGPLPASLQAGNTPYPIMDKISGMLGGGNPLQQQNNAYVKGKVDEYMANVQAAKARAQQKGAQSAARELKKSQETNPPPQLATPGTGQTPTNPLLQLWQNIQASMSGK